MPREKFDTITHTLVAAVGAGASFTVAYPAGKGPEDYSSAGDHLLISNSIRPLQARSREFSIVFGASNMTVTLASAVALPISSVINLNLDRAYEDDEALASPTRMALSNLTRMLLGAASTAVATAVCASQTLNTGANGLINGTLAAAGVATLGVPRNVVAAWTGTAVLTVTGTDEYGQAMVESSASGTTFTGKKAFKTITRVQVSANVTGLTVGDGNVLGLPVMLPEVGDVLKEIVDGAVAGAAGTFVAGDRATPTATTGDVRGTWAPNAAPNGARVYEVIAALRSLTERGRTNFA